MAYLINQIMCFFSIGLQVGRKKSLWGKKKKYKQTQKKNKLKIND